MNPAIQTENLTFAYKDKPVLYGVCPDDPEVTAEALLRFDACVAVGGGFAATDEVGVMDLPGGTYAVGMHRGSYSRLAETYLDVIGLLPPREEVEKFVAADAADKRARLVERLLADRAGYAGHWLTFWNDLLRNDYSGTGYIDGGRKQITGWLYQ